MNKIFKKNLLSRILLFLLFLAVFIFIYDLNLLYPIFADDWDYSYVYWRPERITNVFQVFQSQAIHYVKWGGRSVLHGILQTLLFFGFKWADLLNSLAFVFYIWIIYKIANIRNKLKPSLLVLIFFFIWFLQVNLGETVLWLSGSVNYLWGTSIILAFIYPYHKYLIEYLSNKRSLFWVKKGKSTKLSVLFLFLGIIAGWTNENMSLALIFMIVLIIEIVYKKTKKIENWTVYGVVGAVIGTVIMYLAPGNRVRYRLRLQALGISNPSPKSFYYDNISSWFHLVLDNLTIICIILSALISLFIVISKHDEKKILLISSFLFILSALLATLSLVVAPEFSERMLFGVINFLIVAISIIYSHLKFNNLYFKGIKTIFFFISLFYFIQTYEDGRNYLTEINKIVLDREKQIEEQKAEGKQNIILHSKTFDKREDLIIPQMIDLPITDDSTMWLNQAYCRYYGIKTKKNYKTVIIGIYTCIRYKIY